eukprot:gene10738-11926_t
MLMRRHTYRHRFRRSKRSARTSRSAPKRRLAMSRRRSRSYPQRAGGEHPPLIKNMLDLDDITAWRILDYYLPFTAAMKCISLHAKNKLLNTEDVQALYTWSTSVNYFDRMSGNYRAEWMSLLKEHLLAQWQAIKDFLLIIRQLTKPSQLENMIIEYQLQIALPWDDGEFYAYYLHGDTDATVEDEDDPSISQDSDDSDNDSVFVRNARQRDIRLIQPHYDANRQNLKCISFDSRIYALNKFDRVQGFLQRRYVHMFDGPSLIERRGNDHMRIAVYFATNDGLRLVAFPSSADETPRLMRMVVHFFNSTQEQTFFNLTYNWIKRTDYSDNQLPVCPNLLEYVFIAGTAVPFDHRAPYALQPARTMTVEAYVNHHHHNATHLSNQARIAYEKEHPSIYQEWSTLSPVIHW